ncbi:MAG: ATP-binding protein [Thiovulaceae bacterium]|nr:ATP-binding protein [Sulfurimonadaceae bacterium]
MKSNSLKRKLLLWFGGVTAFILLLFSISFYYFLSNSINENIKIQLQHQAIDIENSFESQKNIMATFAIIEHNQVTYKTADFNLQNLDFYLQNSHSFFILSDEESSENINALYIYKGKKNSIVVYRKNIDNKVEDLVSTLLILNPILLLVLIFMASKMIDKILNPIHSVIKTAKEISVNNFSATIPRPKDSDEIRELIDSFNAMIERLRAGVESLDRFNSDVSHELKTPLTVILGEIEVTLRKRRESYEYEKSMRTIHHETSQIQKIVENLLLLTRYTKENIADSFEPCSLNETLLHVSEKYSKQLSAKNITLIIDKIDKTDMMANPLLITLIYSNLIDNAIKYSETNTKIHLSLYKNEAIHFIIEDEGIGITKEQLSKITERFYRVDESRNKKIEGFGLGLFIVKQSVELHNGTMHINSTLGKGTKIEIVF